MPEKEKTERKLSLGKLVGGFKNPKTRPRFIIWTGSAVFFLAGFVLFALMVTSTNWFCAEVCHGVQVDSVAAWEMSTHANVPCVTCHMPVNADPITHVIKKAGSLLKLYKTAAGQYQQPLNADQSVALNDFPDELCTQCHTDNRNFTPSPGIIIDHAVHTENEVRCAHCHNRVGHIQDDIVLAAEDPNTGEIGWRLDDWMEKPGCFRCHGQEEDAAATGECAACHTPDFELLPADHTVDNFVSEVHADMAMEEYARVEAARVRAEELKPEVAPGVEAYTPAEPDHPWTDIPPANQINYCYTCHAQSFCSDCHGMEMPHPAGFEVDHGDVGRDEPESCTLCHAVAGDTAEQQLFCNACHHPAGNPALPWVPQHVAAVRDGGAQPCFECHSSTFCAECHVRVAVDN